MVEYYEPVSEFIKNRKDAAEAVEEALANDEAAKYMEGEELPQIATDYLNSDLIKNIEDVYQNPSLERTKSAVEYIKEEEYPPITETGVTDMEKVILFLGFLSYLIKNLMETKNETENPRALGALRILKDFEERLKKEMKDPENIGIEEILYSLYDQIEELEERNDHDSMNEYVKINALVAFLTQPFFEEQLESEAFLDWAEKHRERRLEI